MDADPPPEYETHWYSPRGDFWCVWGYGFADESACGAAADRAIAKVVGDGEPAYIRGGALPEGATA